VDNVKRRLYKKTNYWKIIVILIIIWFAGGIPFRLLINTGEYSSSQAAAAHRLVWLIAIIATFIRSYKFQIKKKWLGFIIGLILMVCGPGILCPVIGAVFVFSYLKIIESVKLLDQSMPDTKT